MGQLDTGLRNAGEDRRAWSRKAALALTAAAVFWLLAGCRAEPPPKLSVEDVRARILPTGGMGAVYFVIRNEGGQDRLMEVVAPAPVHASLHESVRDDGVARMVARSRVPIPAHGRLTLAPGGLHVMLSGLPQPAPAGLRLTLRFARHEDIIITVPVNPAADAGR